MIVIKVIHTIQTIGISRTAGACHVSATGPAESTHEEGTMLLIDEKWVECLNSAQREVHCVETGFTGM